MLIKCSFYNDTDKGYIFISKKMLSAAGCVKGETISAALKKLGDIVGCRECMITKDAWEVALNE